MNIVEYLPGILVAGSLVLWNIALIYIIKTSHKKNKGGKDMKATERAEKLWQLFDLCEELGLDKKAIREIVYKRELADRLGENPKEVEAVSYTHLTLPTTPYV